MFSTPWVNLAMIYEESTGFDAQFHIKMYVLPPPTTITSICKESIGFEA
jgi:hypothetical protein